MRDQPQTKKTETTLKIQGMGLHVAGRLYAERHGVAIPSPVHGRATSILMLCNFYSYSFAIVFFLDDAALYHRTVRHTALYTRRILLCSRYCSYVISARTLQSTKFILCLT